MYLYILESQRDFSHYVGITEDTIARLMRHNGGLVRSTKNKRPWIIIYREEHVNRIAAREREKYLKSYSGAGEKRGIIENYTKRSQ